MQRFFLTQSGTKRQLETFNGTPVKLIFFYHVSDEFNLTHVYRGINYERILICFIRNLVNIELFYHISDWDN